MSYPLQTPDEEACRLIVLELFRAQEACLRAIKAPATTDAVIAQAWDRVEETLRRRDDFLGENHFHGHDRERQAQSA